ncbi:hypothetical protein EYF80_004851 [Liparis tanakae]|uniref:Uncharacterized protein n=1 Tax=Liparis tanakae TaxID=230148 RepID=A0A4Z2J3N0_9TELE|nr:hypothetical protein EYF80_004851 [Liparis tanakae]
MERLSLAFSKIVTVLSEEQLLGDNKSLHDSARYNPTSKGDASIVFASNLLMMRLHLFLSVEYGLGVAQQLFITTLNLRGDTGRKECTHVLHAAAVGAFGRRSPLAEHGVVQQVRDAEAVVAWALDSRVTDSAQGQLVHLPATRTLIHLDATPGVIMNN